MRVIKGIGISKGYAIGQVIYFEKTENEIRKEIVEDIANELSRLNKAKEEADLALDKLYQDALLLVGKEEAEIFNMHKILLKDEDFIGAVEEKINSDKVVAEFAVWEAGLELQEMFRMMDNDYMKERAADIKDISNRLVGLLTGSIKTAEINERGVLFALDLTPSETIQMDKSKIKAMVTQKGSGISHSAILARGLGIPAVVGVDSLMDQDIQGTVIVDGFEGTLYIDPDEETLDVFQKKSEAYIVEIEQLKLLKDIKGQTKDGVEVEIACNIGSVEDVTAVLENGGESIGLFRSEFLYMQSEDFPSELFQYDIYKQVLEMMGSKRVIVRTLDLGADKHVPYFNLGEEQYTMAVDRMNSKISNLYDSRNISVLRMIKMAAENAHKEGKWVGICGESAADVDLLKLCLSMGIDELSVSPGSVPEIKMLLKDIDVEKIREKELENWLS